MPVSTAQMFNYPSYNFHLFPSNPYPVQQPTIPTTIAHKVWIVDCRTCHTFLTNRAMKAVLLLRPNVALYSSDTLPINCSVYSSHSDAQPHPSSNKNPSEPVSHRTCECLTQTLCCHGCGNTVGYMIVIPCARCTSSISASNRATNGHRFVFHSSEVVGTERHYVKGENGVNPIEPPQIVVNTPTVPSMQSSTHYSPPYHTSHLPPYSPRPSEPPRENQSPSVIRSDYLPTPPLEFASTAFLTTRHQYPGHNMSPESFLTNLPAWGSRSPPPLSPAQSQLTSNPSSADPRDPSSTFQTGDHKDYPVQHSTLKPGDNVFWHHLTRSGEISGVADDERARFAKTTPFFNR